MGTPVKQGRGVNEWGAERAKKGVSSKKKGLTQGGGSGQSQLSKTHRTRLWGGGKGPEKKELTRTGGGNQTEGKESNSVLHLDFGSRKRSNCTARVKGGQGETNVQVSWGKLQTAKGLNRGKITVQKGVSRKKKPLCQTATSGKQFEFRIKMGWGGKLTR